MNIEIPLIRPRPGQSNRRPDEAQKRKLVEAVLIHGLPMKEVCRRSGVAESTLYKYIEILEYDIRLNAVENDVDQLKQITVPITLPPNIGAYTSHDEALEELSGDVKCGPYLHKESGMWLLMDFQQAYDYERSRAY